MIYPKISQTISNSVNDNIRQLATLFPSAVKDGELDIDALKQELGEFVEVGPEKYDHMWAGKKESNELVHKPILGKTLKFIKKHSKNHEKTNNLFIEGDNLETLKLLRQNYYGAIKVIYIDPPYNSGEDFIYNDNYKMNKKEHDIIEGDVSIIGERYTKNRKDHNRYHTIVLQLWFCLA